MITNEDGPTELTESDIRRSLAGKMSRDKIDRYIEIYQAKNKRNVIINPLAKG